MKRFLKSNTIRYILYSLAVLPIFIFRDFTMDNELRYLSIADEALQNGSFFTFTNHGLIYADKPPLYLWIVMLGKLLLGHHSLLFLGLFSFVPALVIIYTMDQWVKNILSETERLIGELMLLTSSFFIGTAIVLRMDMLMCMFIVLSLYTFFRMYNGTSKPRDTFLFPLFVFMAVFTKGPLGIIIPLLSTSVFLIIKKEFHSIGKYWHWKTMAIIISLCGIWFAGVYVEGGSPFLKNLLYNQTVNRAINSFSHQEPFFYYFKTIWYSLAPWSLFYFAILAVGLIKKLGSTDLELFFLAIAGSTLTVLSLFSSKLAVYMLPTFPVLVYLSVLWLSKLGTPRWTYLLMIIPAFLLCMALPGIIVSQYFDIIITPLVLTGALILTLSGIFTVRHLINNRLNRGIITMCAGMLLAVFTISFTIPNYNSMIGMNELCVMAKDISSKKGVANYYYCNITRADNLDIYLGVIPQMLSMHDLYQTDNQIKKPAILFLSDKAIDRNDSLKIFIKGKKIHQSGNYYCVEIEE